jgi:hypothetical protein
MLDMPPALVRVGTSAQRRQATEPYTADVAQETAFINRCSTEIFAKK